MPAGRRVDRGVDARLTAMAGAFVVAEDGVGTPFASVDADTTPSPSTS
jgi:hypothetical protein